MSFLIKVGSSVGFQEHFRDSNMDFWRLTQIHPPYREYGLNNFIIHSLNPLLSSPSLLAPVSSRCLLRGSATMLVKSTLMWAG